VCAYLLWNLERDGADGLLGFREFSLMWVVFRNTIFGVLLLRSLGLCIKSSSLSSPVEV
jgi:hypothetical protein